MWSKFSNYLLAHFNKLSLKIEISFPLFSPFDKYFFLIMPSRRKASTKSHHDRSVPNGCSSQYDNIAPNVEFVEHSIDPEEANAYWVARGNLKPPRPGTWHPHPFHADPVEGCLSRSCPNGLAAIRSFCRVPESVEFHLPVAGEVAESPPDGYFTCFEAYLMQFHLWFPLLEFIVRLFSRFRLSINQVNPCGFQHIVWILVLSYERGITLDVDHLDGMLMPIRNLATVRLSPRNHMAIIAEFVSNFRDWKSFFFFVRIDNASMEESCIPILRTRWGRKDTFDWLHASLDDIQS